MPCFVFLACYSTPSQKIVPGSLDVSVHGGQIFNYEGIRAFVLLSSFSNRYTFYQYYDLVTLNTLIFMFSVNSKLRPEKYCNMFVLNSNFHSYSTRQKHYFHLPKVKLALSPNSLSYVGIKLWNQLEESIKKNFVVVIY